MANSDSGNLQSQPQNTDVAILNQLKIITILLREGIGIQDEDSSLVLQTNPSTSTTGAL